jgi:hypothetical protein
MSDQGYEDVLCEFCLKREAGYSRRPKFAHLGAWMDACETCARKPYEEPKQQEKT